MGMTQLLDTTHKRLNRYRKAKFMRDLHPKGKITHSMVIDEALNALDEKLKRAKIAQGVE